MGLSFLAGGRICGIQNVGSIEWRSSKTWLGPRLGPRTFSARVVEDVLTLGFFLARRMGTDSGGRKGRKGRKGEQALQTFEVRSQDYAARSRMS